METMQALGLLIAFFVIYFLPSLVAFDRGHHQKAAIFVLNCFAGWTVIFWVAALVWAASYTPNPRIRTTTVK